jgi:sugar lactone lactonase YvrE
MKHSTGQSIEIFRVITLMTAFSATVIAAQTPSFLPTVVTIAGNHTAGNTGNNGPATSAMLSSTVSGSTIDPNGNIYIADTGNNVIRKVDTRTGIITTIAGTGVAGYTQDGIAANTSELSAPGAVRYYQGGLFITDFGNHRIRRVDLTTGIITTVVGGGTGSLANATPVLAGTAITVFPQDVAFDSLGNMYFSQANGASRVNVYNFSTGMAQIFAGTGGTSGATGTNTSGPCVSGKFPLTGPECTIMNGTYGVAVDAQNNVYVDETATGVIRKITVGTVPVETTYAGIGIGTGAAICAAATDSVGDGCPATGASFAHGTGTTLGHFSIDGNGTIYLADGTNNRVRMIPVNPSNPSVGGIVTTIAGTGVAADSPDGGYAQGSAIGNPFDAQILPNGDLLIAERAISSMRLLHLPGITPQTALGASSAQTVNVLTQAGAGSFTLPTPTDFTVGAPVCVPGVNVPGTVCSVGVSFMPTLAGLRNNALQFTDSNGSVVAGLSGVGLAPAASLLPGLISTAAGTGTEGATGDGAAATSAELNMPSATAVDSQGNVYIADTANNEVRKVALGGTITRIAGTGAMGSSGDGAAATGATLNAPAGVALDAAGNLYIADTGNNKIRMVDAVSGNISTVAGTGTAGYTGDQSTPAAATLNGPTQLAWAQTGILYVADTGNSAIRAIALKKSLITTVAGTANAGFDGDGGAGQAAQLQNPRGVAVDNVGNVYIADTGNNRVRLLTEGTITTIAGQQGGGYIGDGSAAATELNAPAGLAVDSAGDLYVADTQNERIRMISGGQIWTVAGTSTTGATGDNGTSAVATLNAPTGIALDSLGNLYVADTGNNKVRAINVGTNSLAFKTLNPGESSPVQTVALFDSGNQPLSLTSVSVPPGYVEQASTSGTDCISTPPAPLTLAAGGSCNLNTVFNPPSAGPYNGAITLSDNAQGSATATQSIAVQGTSAIVFTASLTLPNAATAGTPIAGQLTVNNPVDTYTGTMAFTSTDPQATLPANYTFTTSDAGAHTIAVTLKTAGPQCVTATDTVDPTVTTTACTNVSAATAAKIAVFSGNNQTANVRSAFTQHLIALVTDTYGNPIQKASVVFTIASGGTATGTFANGTATDTEITDLSGFASATTITTGPTIGPLTVKAALAGTSSTVNFTLSVTVLGSFTIVPDSTQVGPVTPAISSSVPMTITGAGGFNAPVALTCSSPAGTTCSVSPLTVPFNNGVEVQPRPVLTFQGEGNLSSAGATHGWWPAAIVMLLGLLVFGRRRRLGALLLAIVALLAIGSVSGCSGTMYAPTTPNGSYTVTVTGTSQNLSAKTTVTFTVQQ